MTKGINVSKTVTVEFAFGASIGTTLGAGGVYGICRHESTSGSVIVAVQDGRHDEFIRIKVVEDVELGGGMLGNVALT